MASSTYPSATSVEILLKSASFWPTDATKQVLARQQAEIGASAAADEWEKRTGWNPFLMPQNAPFRTRPYNGADLGGVLNLRGAAQEIQSVSVGTRTLDFGRGDYVFLASNDPDDLAFEPPYTAILFSQPPAHLSKPGQVRVTARWGFCTELPPLVFQQILQAAALVALTSIENLQSIASISVDGFSKAFDVVGIVTQKDLLQVWAKDFIKASALYTRASAL